MVTNFEKKTENSDPLLQHDDVTTFFHEFGHIMHTLCTKGNFSSLAGTNVEDDFAEMPS